MKLNGQDSNRKSVQLPKKSGTLVLTQYISKPYLFLHNLHPRSKLQILQALFFNKLSKHELKGLLPCLYSLCCVIGKLKASLPLWGWRWEGGVGGEGSGRYSYRFSIQYFMGCLSWLRAQDLIS